MPIGGFVISLDPACKESVLDELDRFPQVELHGIDEKGQAVAVIDTPTSEEMEAVTSQLQKIAGVLSLGVAYFHAEDEIEKIARGEIRPTLSFGRKGEKQADRP